MSDILRIMLREHWEKIAIIPVAALGMWLGYAWSSLAVLVAMLIMAVFQLALLEDIARMCREQHKP